MTDLNESALFNEISKAIGENDVTKLSELTKEQAPVEEEQPLTPQPEEVEELEVPEENQPEEEEEEIEKSPSEETDKGKAEPKEKEATKELTDSEKLAQALKKLEDLEKANHSLKSQVGRVPNVQRRIRELDKKLEELNQKQTSPSSQLSESVLAKIKERFKGIRATDSELADAFEQAMVDALSGVHEQTTTQEKETLQFLRAQEVEAYEQAERERFLAMYPNAPEVFRSSHWKNWKASKSEGVKALAESSNADDVALAFELYTKDMYTQYPELAKAAQGSPAKETSGANPDAVKTAQQIEAERAARRAKTAQVGTTGAPAKVAVPDDPQSLFDKYVKDIEKANS